MSHGRKPTRDFDSLAITHNKERAVVPLSCEYDHTPYVHEEYGGTYREELEPKTPTRQPSSKQPPRPYAELRAASAFSFLDGASLPEDLVDQAAQLDLPAVALIDTNGVYGAPRFYSAAKKAGVRALVGGELVLEEGPSPGASRHPLPASRGEGTLTVLVENRAGYRNLCRLLTAGAAGREKGQARFNWELIEQHAEGLHCLTRADDETVRRVAAIFRGRTHLELQRHRRRDEEHQNVRLVELARRLRLPLVATNGVRYARKGDKELHDILTCIREGTDVDKAGRLLGVNRERHIKPAAEMCALFKDLPEAIDGAWALANTLDFTLADLGYQFPDYPLPPGETNMSFLRKIAWNAAMARFRPLTARAQKQIEKELNMIEKLDLAGYFLIVWDIVRFCNREKILVQGRGSAANSAVCYALGITAVDPVKMDLLFERFLSEERGEWPDIDLDLPSGDQREKVIQHVYSTYGAHGAAMTANVITYRDRSAAREVGKALGYSLEQAGKLSKCVSAWHFGEIREAMENLPGELAKIGFDPDDRRVQHFMRLYLQIQNLPRHLGQHSGGIVMAKGRLDEVVPLEPASMPGRVVVQWDKDDCADLGIIKVDLLGLGMLAAIEEAIPLIRDNEGVEVDLAHLPQDDPLVYKMLNEADTVGMFQVESRAQMASLPRNAPAKFYDIVVQVAIIRPGPIVGGMVRPFFDRRQGKAPVEYPHPCLEPILKRTLGVPLFQEQLLRIAMVAANFTGGEAEELRRAMGFKRSMERMQEIEGRLREGMTKNGIGAAAQQQIVKSITSFALYGFPESHAASFALIAYASAYLKARHPAAFYIALLNAWPMGFYHPATLVKDAQRHEVEVFPIDVNHSGWMCRWEKRGVRMGLRFIKGLREAMGKTIESAQPFTSVEDLAVRSRLRNDQLTKLAYAGALRSLGLTRRAALWQAAKAAKPAGELFEGGRECPLPLAGEGGAKRRVRAPSAGPSLRSGPPSPPRRGGEGSVDSPLPEMTLLQETSADYAAMELTTGAHLLDHYRAALDRENVITAADLKRIPTGRRVATAGAVIVRQRPGTAKGFVFLTLEDETGMSQAIISPPLFREHRSTILGNSGLIVEGILQNSGGQCSIRAEKFWPLGASEGIASHDFH
ncbi:MAG TPA: error-prone DNA polymerase [Thermoanaerobaculia bacterium]|nr:error-prone DNA polymerase [Thermoanaerobaculia bacterium]